MQACCSLAALGLRVRWFSWGSVYAGIPKKWALKPVKEWTCYQGMSRREKSKSFHLPWSLPRRPVGVAQVKGVCLPPSKVSTRSGFIHFKPSKNDPHEYSSQGPSHCPHSPVRWLLTLEFPPDSFKLSSSAIASQSFYNTLFFWFFPLVLHDTDCWLRWQFRRLCTVSVSFQDFIESMHFRVVEESMGSTVLRTGGAEPLFTLKELLMRLLPSQSLSPAALGAAWECGVFQNPSKSLALQESVEHGFDKWLQI